MNDDLVDRVNSLPDMLSSYSNGIDQLMLKVTELKNQEEIDRSVTKIEEYLKELDKLLVLLVKDTGNVY